MRHLFSTTAVGALCVTLGSVAPAIAADAAPTNVDELIVTALRREQAVQDVGAALSVVSGAELAEKNISVVNDLENTVPNLEVDSQFGGGQPQFRIRGIGAREYSSNNSSTVGVYVDEVAHPYTVTTQGALFDVSRLEVLRGPQGTLYGRNTTGGAVNIITNAPTSELSAGVVAEYGTYDRFRVEGFVSGALAPNLRARLAAVTEQGGAWQYNRDTNEELGDADRTAIRGRLSWDASEATRVDLSATYTRDKSDGMGFRLLSPYGAANGVVVPADTEWRITGWRISPGLAAIAGVDTDAKPFRNNEGFDASLVVRSDLGDVVLTSVSAFQDFRRREYNDWDGTRFAESDVYFYNDIRVLSQEVRLASDTDTPLQWLVGAHYADEENDGGFYTEFRGIPSILDTSYAQDVRAFGVFGNLTYALSERLTLVGGLRYEDEERKLDNGGTRRVDGVVFTPPDKHKATLSEVSGKAGVEYRAAEDVLLYANVARGVKSGGFTTYNATSATPFKPEIVWAYEAGLKSQWFDRALTLNAAAFYYDYRDQQVQGLEYDREVGRLGKITNVPKSTIWGAEAELVWRVTPALTVFQNASFKKGQYNEYFAIDGTATDAANPVNGPWTVIISNDRSGERLGFPRYTYAGGVSYDLALSDWVVRAETNYAYRSSLYSTTTTSVIPSYWVVNASIGVSPADRDWTVTLWARNLFNEYYEETRNGFNSSSRRTTSPHQPRTVGVRVAYQY